MKQKILKCVSVSLAFLFLLSCITVNIYFPEAEVKKAAEEIVGEIVKEEGGKEKKDKKVQMMELDQMSLSLGSSSSLVPSVFIQEDATKVSTPKTRALQNAIRERRSKLKPFFESGNIGEKNDGFIEIRDESGLNLRDKALLRSLEKDENNDRRNLYAEVAAAKEIDSSQIPRIQKIFAQEWIKNAEPGWWVQKENGEWVKKQ